MRLHVVCLLAWLPAAAAEAQAPGAATLWDLPATTLAGSPALETGAVGAFWNPAGAVRQTGFDVAAQAFQSPDEVGMSGAMFALAQPLTSHLTVGAVFGRLQMGDLIRTSTSPAADAGDIPVYEQTGGVLLGVRIGALTAGTLVRGHDARFDVFREAGITTDLGARFEPVPWLTIAGASRFQPPDFKADDASRYSAGVSLSPIRRAVWGAPATVAFRYGFTARKGAAVEHTVGTGIELDQKIRVDASGTRETGLAGADWRLVVALGIRAGRYDVLAARGSGLRGIGANYRVGLEVNFGK